MKKIFVLLVLLVFIGFMSCVPLKKDYNTYKNFKGNNVGSVQKVGGF